MTSLGHFFNYLAMALILVVMGLCARRAARNK